MNSLFQEFQNLLRTNNISPKKYLGQNFLIDKNILENITSCSNISKTDTVIEIGPGMGALTDMLINTVKKVISIEIDKDMFHILTNKYKDNKNLNLINQDALTYIPKVKKYKIIANIPYYITSPLINHYLNLENKASSITLLIQKEVAEKICEEKNSIIKLMVELNGKATYIKTVSENCFYPAPKVKSAIIKIEVYLDNQTSTKEKEETLKIAKIAFTGKRKKAINTLSSHYKIEKTEIIKILEKLNLDKDTRPERITTEKWLEFNKEFQRLIKR